MDAKLIWDEAKRQINLRKHGLDFASAGAVLDSRFRRASREEREAYLVWIENECDER